MSKLKPIPVYPKFKKASQALAAARDLIRSEKRWTQNDLAVKTIYKGTDYEQTKACSTKSPNAVAFCALGAVKRVNGPAEKSATAFLRQAAAKFLDEADTPINEDIFTVNDVWGHESTLKMFSLAIKSAKKAGK